MLYTRTGDASSDVKVECVADVASEYTAIQQMSRSDVQSVIHSCDARTCDDHKEHSLAQYNRLVMTYNKYVRHHNGDLHVRHEWSSGHSTHLTPSFI